MKKRRIALVIGLILVCVTLLSLIWEYVVEDAVLSAFGIRDAGEFTRLDTWLDTLNAVVATALALIVPAVLLHRRETERARVQESLKQSEAKYRALIDASPGAIFIHDGEKIIYANKSAVRLLRAKSAADLIGKSPLSILHPDYHGMIIDRLRAQTLEEGSSALVEKKYVCLDGAVIDVESRGVPFEINGEKTFLVMAHDIGARKRAEADLTRQKTVFEAVFRDVPDAMILTTPDQEIVMCNPAFSKIFGYSESEILGQTPAMIYSNSEEFERRGRIRFNLDTEESRDPYVVSYKRKDWTSFPGETVGTPIKDNKGKTLGFLGVIRDVSERIKSEEALRESEARFRDFAGAASDWFWEMGPDLRFTYHSDRYYEITGFQPEGKIGSAPTRYVNPEDLEANSAKWAAHMSDLVAHRTFKNFEFAVETPNGGVCHMRLSGTPFFDSGGAFLGFRGTGTDVTEHKKAEEALKTREEQYRTVVDFSPNGMFIHDHGVITYVNPAMVDLMGASDASELIGTPALAHIPPEFKKIVEKRIQNLLKTGRSAGMIEQKYLRLDGTVIDVEAQGTPISYLGQESVLVIIRDITERKKAEEALRISDERFRGAIMALQEAFALFDPDDRLVFFNDEYRRLHHHLEDLLIPGTRFEEIIRANIDRGLLVLPEGEKKESFIQKRMERHREPKGTIIRHLTNGVVLSIKEYRAPDGGYVATQSDISEVYQAEESLRLAATVFETTAEGIMVTDAENRIKAVNPSFTRITGYTQDDVQGRAPNMLSSGRHDEAFYADMWKRLEQFGRWEGEIWNKRKNGEIYPQWLSIVGIKDSAGKIREYVGVIRDITELKENEELFWRKANFDPLTNLPNRALGADRLAGAITGAKRSGNMVAVMFIDLDGFKNVNDAFGHNTGDMLLQGVARRLAGCVRAEDTVARYGGDEFTIMLTNLTERESAMRVARQVLEALAKPFDVQGKRAEISCSIGLALYPNDGKDPESLIKKADSAMYAAKRSGKNMYRFASLKTGDKQDDQKTA